MKAELLELQGRYAEVVPLYREIVAKPDSQRAALGEFALHQQQAIEVRR